MNTLLRSAGRLLPFAFATAFFTACGDSALGPSTPNRSLAAAAAAQSASEAKSTSNAPPSTMTALDPTAPPTLTVGVLSFRAGINTSVSATKVIGSEGGFLTLAETGFTLWVPAGAVNKPTTFKVTPVASGLVAYDFEPRGSKFAVPLMFSQDLSKTIFTAGMSLGGAYFTDATKVHGPGKTADVSELFSLTFGTDGWAFFSITHFSGYLVSCA